MQGLKYNAAENVKRLSGGKKKLMHVFGFSECYYNLDWTPVKYIGIQAKNRKHTRKATRNQTEKLLNHLLTLDKREKLLGVLWLNKRKKKPRAKRTGGDAIATNKPSVSRY